MVRGGRARTLGGAGRWGGEKMKGGGELQLRGRVRDVRAVSGSGLGCAWVLQVGYDRMMSPSGSRGQV